MSRVAERPVTEPQVTSKPAGRPSAATSRIEASTLRRTHATGPLTAFTRTTCIALAGISLVSLAVGMTVRDSLWWLNVSWGTAGLFAMITTWQATRHAVGAWRRTWRILAAAAAVWLVGLAVWIYFAETAFPDSPNVADLAWFLFGGLGMTAMYVILAASHGPRWAGWAEMVLLIVAVGAGIIAALYEMSQTSTLPAAARASAIAYPVVFASIPVVLIQAVLSSPRSVRSRLDIWTLFAGMFVEAVAFMLWAPGLLNLTYVPGDTLEDVLWSVGMLVVGLSALMAPDGDLPQPLPDDPPRVTRVFLPSAAFMTLLAGLLYADIAGASGAVHLILVLSLVPVGVILVGSLAATVGSQRRLIVDEREVRAAMIRARNVTERFFEISRDLMVMVGPNRELVRINPAWTRMLGWDRNEVVDKRLIDFVHPDDVERTNEAVGKLFEGEDMNEFSNRFRALDGTWHWLTWQAVFDAEEQLVFARAADTTESRRMSRLLADLNKQLEERAAELERSNADLQQFASIASHELREPLRTISGFSRLIERRYADQIDERADSYIKFILQGVDRMGSLIEALLRFSKVGQSAARRAQVNTNALVDEVIRDMRSVIESSEAEITVGPLPQIDADPYLITWIFQNLISNAIKYCDESSPRITVEGAEVDGGWEFAVTDNGIGIEPRHADRIFSIFQRLHGRDEYGGTGIGLAVCRRAVELHGGSIHVEPAESGGSKFVFNIPFAADTETGGSS